MKEDRIGIMTGRRGNCRENGRNDKKIVGRICINYKKIVGRMAEIIRK